MPTEFGGIVGSNHKTVDSCFNKGEIKADGNVGGITGTNFDTKDNIENCFNMGKVTGGANTGGISGRNGSTGNSNCFGAIIKNCYNIGEINSNSESSGNIAGHNKDKGCIDNCYYIQNGKNAIGTNESSEISTYDHKTADEFKTNNFIETLNNGTSKYAYDEKGFNGGNPILSWQIGMKIIQPKVNLKLLKLKSKIFDAKVYKDNKEILDDSAIINTGITVKLDGVAFYTIIISGDVNGDGNVGLLDLILANRQRLGKNILSGIYFEAGDTNSDGEINIIDLIQMNRFRLEK